MQASLQFTFSGHSGAVYSLDSDGQFIYSAAADKFVTRWNPETGEQDAFAIRLPHTPYTIALFSGNTKLAVGLNNGDLHFFDLAARSELKFYQQHITGIFALKEDAVNKQLFAGDAEGNLSVWDTETMMLKIFLPLGCGKIRRIAVCNERGEVLICGGDGRLLILDALSFNELSAIKAHDGGTSAVLALNPGYLLTGGKDARLRLWDRLTGQELKSLPAHNYVIYDILAMNPESFLTASRDKTIKGWDAKSLNVLQRIERKQGGHSHSVNALVRIDNKRFASCSDDGKIKLWEISD